MFSDPPKRYEDPSVLRKILDEVRSYSFKQIMIISHINQFLIF